MDAAIYRLMRQVEDEHWWFVGRRRIVRDVLDRNLAWRPQRTILDAGCGTGGNLAMLSCFGLVRGIEPDPLAAESARARGDWRIDCGALPDGLDEDAGHFDLITLTDVLEHLDDDEGVLRALGSRLAPGGLVLVTVPAFPFLWSDHDVTHHHRRRYTAGSLRACVEAAGLEVALLSYFNAWLFPLIACARLMGRLHRRASPPRSALAMPVRPLNTLLTRIFSSESMVLRHGVFPAGVSILALLRQPGQTR